LRIAASLSSRGSSRAGAGGAAHLGLAEDEVAAAVGFFGQDHDAEALGGEDEFLDAGVLEQVGVLRDQVRRRDAGASSVRTAISLGRSGGVGSDWAGWRTW
jgi:hypothetical protein